MFKHALKILFIFSISTSARADFKDAGEAVAKLKSYPDNFYAAIHDESTLEEENKKSENVGPSEAELNKTTDFFIDLEFSVNILLTQKSMDINLVDEVVRLANISMLNDPTRYAAEVIAPAYHKDPKAFKSAIEKMSKSDAKSFEKSLKNAQRELKKGNG